ncbi:hypothetical protein [Schlesneria paludicola]|uniref:hypothetical protein n=1 Tax=Schlesneria paludicola TaxID=360056 RepID=UPI00029A490E|nr:hypothetical protein [Schlesneria paludicola]
MARLSRAEVFAPDEIAIVHVMNRVVRRCFLLGTDSVTGKNYDHRKAWIEQLLQQFAAQFGIDLLDFAILSNHFPLILRSRPDVVATWDDTEVARRWLMLCPVRKDREGLLEEPNEAELGKLKGVREIKRCQEPFRVNIHFIRQVHGEFRGRWEFRIPTFREFEAARLAAPCERRNAKSTAEIRPIRVCEGQIAGYQQSPFDPEMSGSQRMEKCSGLRFRC